MHNTLLCWDLQARQLLNHFDATARQDNGTPYERPREELRSHGASISRSHGMECEQRVPLSPSSSFLHFCFFIFGMLSKHAMASRRRRVPHAAANACAHKLPLSADCICPTYLHSHSHSHSHSDVCSLWLEPGKIYSMLLIELN